MTLSSIKKFKGEICMKIKLIEKFDNATTLGSVDILSTFRFAGEKNVYMKIKQTEHYNVVCLNDGTLIDFSDNAIIRLVEPVAFEDGCMIYKEI